MKLRLAFTEVFGHGAILADNLIYIFYTGLGTNAEALETGVPQDFIVTINGRFVFALCLFRQKSLW